MKNDILDQIRDIKATVNTDKWQYDVGHPTIFHEMLSSKMLPEEEKTPIRLAQEGQILVQGGTLTTSWTLSLALFHVLQQPGVLRKLRDELFAAMPDPDEHLSLVQLENLPYLRAVVREALRHGIGTSSRLGRIAPEETLVCRDPSTGKQVDLPPGTVVSMSPYVTVMDPNVFPDPLGFHPERWLENGERLENFLVIFGGGSRNCLGMALVHAEMHLMLAKLFRRWGGAGLLSAGSIEDRREGDVGAFRIYETTIRDCQMASDYFIPIPYQVSYEPQLLSSTDCVMEYRLTELNSLGK